MQKAQRKLYAALRVAPPVHSKKPDQWPTLEIVGEIIEFYSAQWGHLHAFDDTDRWLHSLPVAPYEERVMELRRLHEELLETTPPDHAAQALGEVLRGTLELGGKLAALAGEGWVDEVLLSHVREHQQALAEVKDRLIEAEGSLVGPVPAIPASSATGAIHLLSGQS